MRIQWRDEWTLPAAVGGVSFLLGAAAGVAGKILRDKKKYTIVEAVVDNGQMQLPFPDAVDQLNHAISRLAAVENRMLKDKVDTLGYSSPATEEEVIAEEEFVPQPEPEVEDDEEFINDMDGEEAMEYYVNRPESPAPEERKLERVSVFRKVDDTWDYAEEIAKRDSKKPYIIHKDEFFEEGDIDFRQSQLTFYEGDHTLVDEYDTVVDQKMVGVLLFGHGSGDPNVCYVRNMSQMAEYEIVRDENAFVLQQMGDEIESGYVAGDLRHSAVPHFRRD